MTSWTTFVFIVHQMGYICGLAHIKDSVCTVQNDRFLRRYEFPRLLTISHVLSWYLLTPLTEVWHSLLWVQDLGTHSVAVMNGISCFASCIVKASSTHGDRSTCVTTVHGNTCLASGCCSTSHKVCNRLSVYEMVFQCHQHVCVHSLQCA